MINRKRYEMDKTKFKNYLGYLFLLMYFIGTIFFQTKFSQNVLLNIYGNIEFWDKFFEIIYYGIFAVAFLFYYKNQIIKNMKDMKITYLKYIGIALVFIIITMVTSAIILSYNGIGESENQESISKSISDYGLITLLVVVVIGPFVEEIVFRGVIYSLLRGKKGNLLRIVIANFFTSLIFAIYHCDIKFFLVFDAEQILSIIPLFFLGVGLSYVKERTSNIGCSIATHIVINLISIS